MIIKIYLKYYYLYKWKKNLLIQLKEIKKKHEN